MSLRTVGDSGVLQLSRGVAFYEGLGFRFPPLEPATQHIEAEGGVRLMIDDAGLLEGLHGEPPRPGNTAGFAVLFDLFCPLEGAFSG